MDGNIQAGNMMQGASYSVLDLQGSLDLHHQNAANPAFNHPSMHGGFPLSINHMPERGQPTAVPFMDYGKGELGKNSVSDEDEPSLPEDGIENHNDKGKKGSPWHRMKWTDTMVKLLITAVSYTGEDAVNEYSGSGKRKCAILQKKGKWKAISKVMGDRGCYVSPQQCEDKFNDLNKRYKRLTDILGRGTSCKVVENPVLLDHMDHIPEKLKEDVRKILSSKHLFYEEMCSYHNGNRLNLPPDPALQRALQLALKSRDEHDPRRGLNEDIDEDDRSADTNEEEDNAEEHHVLHGEMMGPCFHKRMKHGVDCEDAGFANSSCFQDSTRRPNHLGIAVDINQAFPEGSSTALAQKQLMSSHMFQLEEQRLQIQARMLELEQQRFKWERFSKKKDRELERMRMENERMKLENRRMELELKHKELEIDLRLKRCQ